MPICTSATSPSVAANDIWKLGCTSASGAIASTIIAATAQRAERHGAAVDHDGDQHHRRHEERALRRDLGARQQQIERGGDQRGRGRPFLDRKAHGERGISASSARTAKNTTPATTAM